MATKEQIMAAARMLGKMIKESEEGIALEKAKEEWADNDEIRAAYSEYTMQHKVLEQDEVVGKLDPDIAEKVNARVNELYNFITEHEAYKKLDEAQEALNAIVSEANGLIIEEITGSNPNCTHDCSSCSGCSD